MQRIARRNFLKTAGKIATIATFYGLTTLLPGCATVKPAHATEYSSAPTPQYKDIIDQVIQENNLKDTKDLESYLLNNFRAIPESEVENSLKSPEKFVREKGGDCEDYAFFTANVLQRMGYKTELLAVQFKNERGSLEWHYIAIFYDKGWHYLNGYKIRGDNGKISRPFNSPSEMAPIIFENYRGKGTGPTGIWHGPLEEVESAYKRDKKYSE